jgi:type II secretory pathway pseudopilin PulG
MTGGKKHTPNIIGFTIIEVMIFLAVSGVTFLIAAAFINGKEAQAEYTQGMNQANVNIRTLINNVSDGNYPASTKYTYRCILIRDKAYLIPTTSTSGAKTSPGCVFVGQKLQINSNTMTGCQFIGPDGQCTSTLGTPPTDVVSEKPNPVPTLTLNTDWPNGLILKKLWDTGTSSTTLSAVGFFSTPPDDGGGVYSNGSQPVSILTYTSSDTAGTPLTNSNHIVFCLAYGNKLGSITLGAANNGNLLTTSLQMGNTTDSICSS